MLFDRDAPKGHIREIEGRETGDRKMIVISRGKVFSRIVVIVVLVLITVSLLSGLLVVRAGVQTRRASHQRLVHLLRETDYQILLSACRELSARAFRGELMPWTYGVRRNPAPETSTFPQVIIDIQPAYIQIEKDGRVFVEMAGVPSFGIVAYPQDYSIGAYDSGDVELLPGLWYYDEGYKEYADRKEYIDSLVRGGSRQVE